MQRPQYPLSTALLLPALLAGCMVVRPITPQVAYTKHLDVNGPPPDVVIFAVSGRCGPPCKAPRDSWDYLSSRGTVDALASAIAGEGLSVQVAGYADNALDTFYPVKVATPQRGYAALNSDLTRVKAEWFGKPGAPRIVLLGHSHGAVWTHHLAHVNPYVPFALQIDLDGICASWVLDHGPDLAAHPVDLPGQPRAIDACNFMPVGNSQARGKDIVWPNVAQNLVAQSRNSPASFGPGGLVLNYLFEMSPHLRSNGSTQGIEPFRSAYQDHSGVSYPTSDAMKWVLARTAEIARTWKPRQNALPTQKNPAVLGPLASPVQSSGQSPGLRPAPPRTTGPATPAPAPRP